MIFVITPAKVTMRRRKEEVELDLAIFFTGVFAGNDVIFTRQLGFDCPARNFDKWAKVAGIQSLLFVFQGNSDSRCDRTFPF